MIQTDSDISNIRQFVRADVADVGVGICDVNRAISGVQEIGAAVRTIRQALGAMQELTEKAVNRYCSRAEKAQMQEEVLRLAQEVNDIVNSTDVMSRADPGHNKLLSPDGRTVSERIGKERSIHISPRDMSFPAESVDLPRNGKDLLATIRQALTEADEYASYLHGQLEFLMEVISAIEREAPALQQVKTMNYNTSMAAEFRELVGALFSEYPDELYRCQANFTWTEVLHYLQHNN